MWVCLRVQASQPILRSTCPSVAVFFLSLRDLGPCLNLWVFIMWDNNGRDKLEWPSWSQPNIEIGIFKPPGASRKVWEIKKCRDISTYPDLSQLFPTFPSTNLGSYSQKSQKYLLSRYSKSWEKSGNWEKSRLTCLDLSRFKSQLSQPDPNY